MRRKTSLGLLPVALAFAFCSCGTASREGRLIKEGNELVNRIESFRREKGRLPGSLSELGIRETEEGPLYYAKRGEAAYKVWFGTELGESVTYNSDSKKWRPGNE